MNKLIDAIIDGLPFVFPIIVGMVYLIIIEENKFIILRTCIKAGHSIEECKKL